MTTDTPALPEGEQDVETQAAHNRVRRSVRRIGDSGEGPSIWLISFTDVMALMLTFFVLLFAMSNPKEEDWEDFTSTLQNNFNRYYGQALNNGFQDTINIEKIDFNEALDLNYLRALITELIAKENSLKTVTLVSRPDHLIISLPEDMLFESAQAGVRPEAQKALFTLAGTLSRIQNRIEIVGHTDPRPVTGGDYPSNWELSLARAVNIAAALENVGYGNDIIVRGRAAGRYEDLPAIMNIQDRYDLARRVDIVIRQDDGRQRKKLFDISMP